MSIKKGLNLKTTTENQTNCAENLYLKRTNLSSKTTLEIPLKTNDYQNGYLKRKKTYKRSSINVSKSLKLYSNSTEEKNHYMKKR